MQGTDERREGLKAEEDSITRTVLDYFEGWFEGDPGRMGRALHQDLAKRSPGDDPDRLDHLTASEMVDATARGVGATRLQQVGDPQLEVEVVDVHGSIASVTVRSAVYREYLHLVRTPGGWRIANALWDWA
jgi:ketosteroid isomerase-like protein